MRDAMPDLPEGLTTRPLQRSDAHDVFVLMAAQEQEDIGHVAIEEADIVSDWAKPSHDLGARSVGVWDGDTLVAYAELMGADRADTSVLPSHRGRGIGTWLAHWLVDLGRSVTAKHALAIYGLAKFVDPGSHVVEPPVKTIKPTIYLLDVGSDLAKDTKGEIRRFFHRTALDLIDRQDNLDKLRNKSAN